MKTAAFISSQPEAALHHDLNALDGSNHLDQEKWQSILNDLKSNVSLNEESLKSARLLKLNNMPDWELKEIEYENNYAKSNELKKKKSQ